MRKLKCYVIIVSTVFPKGHIREGQSTNFPDLIISGLKKHTIRLNYQYWKKIVNEVNSGNAYLSVRTWTGKPYRSKQSEFIRFTKLGIQKLYGNILEWKIDKCESEVTTVKLSKNDGLNYTDFRFWFGFENRSEPMAIIHFTDFKYK